MQSGSGLVETSGPMAFLAGLLSSAGTDEVSAPGWAGAKPIGCSLQGLPPPAQHGGRVAGQVGTAHSGWGTQRTDGWETSHRTCTLSLPGASGAARALGAPPVCWGQWAARASQVRAVAASIPPALSCISPESCSGQNARCGAREERPEPEALSDVQWPLGTLLGGHRHIQTRALPGALSVMRTMA